MNSQDTTTPGPSGRADLVTVAGIDHVRLVYDYLDGGDLDGCGSLLHDAVVLELPGLQAARGRTGALRALALHAPPGTRHLVDRVAAQDRTVIVTGRRVTGEAAVPEQRFVDVFTIADDGLLRTCVRYFHALS
ncbi:nuclear transport factor 2 family protein [Streptomyces sp. CC208A]|uniref:nuclear transport factor 2 family protein n=1 Tax=Streptomyces sp. CC208A TaxID=3044573 RepID=UPI0024A837BD|nr:nuclear transport factor 2 family protein [Streptomyces sp. CC208A]